MSKGLFDNLVVKEKSLGPYREAEWASKLSLAQSAQEITFALPK
jgi:hypothetical protein